MKPVIDKRRGMLMCAASLAYYPTNTASDMARLTGRSEWTIRKWLREIRAIVEEMGGERSEKVVGE